MSSHRSYSTFGEVILREQVLPVFIINKLRYEDGALLIADRERNLQKFKCQGKVLINGEQFIFPLENKEATQK